jgi:hypothetical protein
MLVVTGLAAFEQRLDIARDESRARVIAQIDPRPCRENHEAITKADQIEDVDEQPSDPGDKTSEPKHLLERQLASLHERRGFEPPVLNRPSWLRYQR